MLNKRLDIELMRIIAAFFVIFNHTENVGFFLFSLYDAHSIQYWIYLFISIFCKFSVPLFFMISGALMLERQPESVKDLWCHRIFHICVIIGVWSFFYYMLAVKEGYETFNMYHFLTRLYDSNWNGSYWYLYTYLSLLISLPLLQRIAQNLRDRDYVYMMILYSVFNMVVPSLQYLLWQGRHALNTNISVGWFASNIVIFPFAGYFLSCRVKNFWNKKRILLLWIINIGTILLSCYLTYYQAKITGVCEEKSSQMFHSTFDLVNSMAIFVTCQYIGEHSEVLWKMRRAIISVGGCTFGIYLLHIGIKDYTSLSAYMQQALGKQMQTSPMLYAFLYCGVIFICGYIVSAVLKRIPFLRRFIS